MFDCCRVPGPEGLDWSISYANPGQASGTGHIIVIRKNRFWKVNATHSGRILGTKEFEKWVSWKYQQMLPLMPVKGRFNTFMTIPLRNILVLVFCRLRIVTCGQRYNISNYYSNPFK